MHNKILYIMAYKESTLTLNIKEHLKASGKTAKELAEAVGISRVTASNIINNKTAPSLETLRRMAEALGVPLWQLFASPEEVAARAQRSGVGGGGLVGVVRVGCEIYTADTVQQLRAIVERLEQEEATKK